MFFNGRKIRILRSRDSRTQWTPDLYPKVLRECFVEAQRIRECFNTLALWRFCSSTPTFEVIVSIKKLVICESKA